MHQQPLVAGHGAAQLRVEREPQAVAGHGLVHRGVPGREGHAGRLVEHLRRASKSSNHGPPTCTGGAHASPAARPRATVWSASLRLASSIISPSSSTRAATLVAGRLLQRGHDRARPLELLRRRGEGGVDGLELTGVHRPLAVEAERAHALGAFAQALRRRGWRGRGRRSPGARTRAPPRAPCPGRAASSSGRVGVRAAAQRRGQVGVARGSASRAVATRRRSPPPRSSPRAVSTSACTRSPRGGLARASRAARPRAPRPPGPRPWAPPASRSRLRRDPPAGSRRRRTTGCRSHSPAPPPGRPRARRRSSTAATRSRASSLAAGATESSRSITTSSAGERGRLGEHRLGRPGHRQARSPGSHWRTLTARTQLGSSFFTSGAGTAGTLLQACLRSRP